MLKKLRNPYFALIFLVGLDQLLKFGLIKVFPQLISLNTGGGFGLGAKLPYYNWLVCAAIIILFFGYYLANARYHAPLVLVIAGALSNQIDRFYRGGAVDYLNFKIYPSFNLADILITVGVIWVAYLFARQPSHSR